MFKRILLATDGSPVIERMILYAAHLARKEEAEIIVLHAYELPERYTTYTGYEALCEQYRAVAQSLLDEVIQQLREDGVAVEGELRAGAAADTIIAAARDNHVDLIVMALAAAAICKIFSAVSVCRFCSTRPARCWRFPNANLRYNTASYLHACTRTE